MPIKSLSAYQLAAGKLLRAAGWSYEKIELALGILNRRGYVAWRELSAAGQKWKKNNPKKVG